MMKPPEYEVLRQLETFLNRCEASAKPWAAGMVETIITPRYVTLEDVLGLSRHHGDQLPFQPTEMLDGARAQRIAVLHAWLRRLHAFTWLHDLPPVQQGLKAFRLLQKTKRRAGSAFADDLAEFRFWRLALCAACLSISTKRPEANAKQRIKAMNAAKSLLKLDNDTTLLADALSSVRRRGLLLLCLEEINAFAKVTKRRTRSDAAGKLFVEQLTFKALEIFDGAPPSLVAKLAGLVVYNATTDSVKATVSKAIKQYKAGLPKATR